MGHRVLGSGFGVWGLGLKVHALSSGFKRFKAFRNLGLNAGLSWDVLKPVVPFLGVL